MLTFALFSDGAPLTGATPAFLVYATEAAARTPPAIRELGGGVYGFEPTAADKTAGVAYIIDGGAAASPRYHAGGFGALVGLAFYDDDGAPWTGVAPTFTQYRSSSGADRTPPALVSLGSGLWAFRPTVGDRVAATSYVVAAASGAEPTTYAGVVPAFLEAAGARARSADLVVERGATWLHSFPALDEDVGDAVLEMEIRDGAYPYGTLWASPALTTDQAGTTVTASLTAEETQVIGMRSGVYDVRAVDGEVATRLFSGRVTVVHDVTRKG